MWAVYLLFLGYIVFVAGDSSEQPISYYYGLDESERGLPLCSERQACSVLLERYWRRAALVRLCRCARRSRCPEQTARDQRTIYLNNRAHFKLCQPVDEWPQCSPHEVALNVVTKTADEYLDPDRLEILHHRNIHMTTPKIIFHCKCTEPYFWDTNYVNNSTDKSYNCRQMPMCRAGEFCGNVHYEQHYLYQTCLCPKNHLCLHSGGLTHVNITELLYEGKGRQAFCQHFYNDETSYEDY